MSVIIAVNYEDDLVLLEDGRELSITAYYANQTFPERGRLTAKDSLMSSDRVPNWKDAEVFVVQFPGTDAALIVEMTAVKEVGRNELN